MCPAGRQPAAANASKCGDAVAVGYSTILYAVVGSVLVIGMLAAAGIMWFKFLSRSSRFKAEQEPPIKGQSQVNSAGGHKRGQR